MQSRSCAQKSGAGYFFNRIYQIIALLHKAIPIYKREGWDGNRTDRRPKHAMDECVLMGGGGGRTRKKVSGPKCSTA